MEVASVQGAGDRRTLTAGADETGSARRPNKRLREIRIERGLSAAELAAAAGISRSRYYGIENGLQRAPSIATATAIAAAVGVDLGELFELRPCECGCGELTLGRLLPGHHARLPGFASTVREAKRRQARERLEQLGLPEEKACERCGSTFSWWHVGQGFDHWAQRRFCSHECAHPLENLPRPCAFCGQTFVGRRGHPETRYCCLAHAGKDLFAAKLERVSDDVLRAVISRALIHGVTGKTDQLIRKLPAGSRRRRLLGPLTGSTPPAPGGRRRGRPRKDVGPKLVALVESYAARGWGYRTILTAAEVRAAGGSEDIVRRLVADYRARVDDGQPTLFPRT
jgi:transcriptional regulator with XRE-family HTH domain